MFVAADVPLELGFRYAEARLADLARSGLLARMSEGAYGDGLTGPGRPGSARWATRRALPSWSRCISGKW